LDHSLNSLYIKLDFSSGELFRLAEWQERRRCLPDDEVLAREKWLDACLKINEKYYNSSFKVDAVFFIQQNPVCIFVQIENNNVNLQKLTVRTLWNLTRPRYVFLNYSDGTESEVYDLASFDLISPMPCAKGILELSKLNRENIQAGYDLLGKKQNRQTADLTLINDLKELRKLLTGNATDYTQKVPKMTPKQAHTLIAQVIFIRYLEDRQILDDAYFTERVAQNNPKWLQILHSAPDKPNLLNPELALRFFPRVLSDRDFTVALFRQLTEDFNGDVFSEDRAYNFVQQEHLTLIQRFLWADMANKGKLFLWAYQFDVIPLELISSIYEEFYHNENKANDVNDKNGTHYTPAVLVEFMLSRTLTTKLLKTNPRVLDAACGSGIFLVEAFRRIVRYKKIFEGYKPAFNSLKAILAEQIRGIEINGEAARVTAFSLYISLLDFLDPPHIRHYLDNEGGKLPYLLYAQQKTEKHLNIILAANAFWVESLFDQDAGLHDFQPGTVDVIVGNPPWGSASKKDIEDKKAIKWCEINGFPVSDSEWSQMFIWRSVKFLKSGGIAGLLVSSGTLLKSSDTSVAFKRSWVSKTSLLEVFNFVLARQVFFDKAISPFVGVVFQNSLPSVQHKIKYWTFRRTRVVERNKVVVLDKTDFKVIQQTEAQVPEIWKICLFGNEQDVALMNGIGIFEPLERLEKPTGRRQGFIEGGEKSKKSEVEWLKEYREMPIKKFNNFTRYEAIPFSTLLEKIPDNIYQAGEQENYEGNRIISKRGINSKGANSGIIWARFENQSYAFRHSINCFKLQSNDENDYTLVLGILWSSVAKYFYLMTVTEWGVWHDSIEPSEMMRLPIPETDPSNEQHAQKIVEIVNSLRTNPQDIAYWEKQLDEAVFNFYYLTNAEKDLIRDRCEYEIGAYYENYKSKAFLPVLGLRTSISGAEKDLPQNDLNATGIEQYLHAFYQIIRPLLKQGSHLHHTIVRSKGLDHEKMEWSDAIAAIFFITQAGENPNIEQESIKDWADVAKFIIGNSKIEISQAIYVEQFLRLVSEKHLVILKRNERRLWSRTAAREDANALFAQSLCLPQNETPVYE
jgi:hypothetical protein